MSDARFFLNGGLGPGKIAVAFNMSGWLDEFKVDARAALFAAWEALSLYRKNFMAPAMLVMGRSINS